MKIKILYEDAHILAIDKPSGVAVHPDGRTKGKTVTDWAVKNYPKMKNIGEPLGDIPRPGVVHRLDRETSGVLLLAKTQKAHAFLKKQFQDRTVRKAYIAIVQGWVTDDRGTIDKPIGRSPSDFRKRLAGRGARGELREAVTSYRVLKRFEEGNNRFTALEVRPKTGRTHQIRVHMKYLNHPVVCDDLYNPGKPAPEGMKRLGLHARSIEFQNLKGEIIKTESPLPEEFEAYI